MPWRLGMQLGIFGARARVVIHQHVLTMQIEPALACVQVTSSAFATPHDRYGVLSWCLAENDDEAKLRQRESYSNTEFLITTGAPCRLLWLCLLSRRRDGHLGCVALLPVRLRSSTRNCCSATHCSLHQARDRRPSKPRHRSDAGSGPQPDLDGENIAFGQLLEGSSALSELAAVPVIKASETMETYNRLATFLGDDRAARAKSKWGKPLRAVVITSSGVL
jgi:hypothetical protein